MEKIKEANLNWWILTLAIAFWMMANAMVYQATRPRHIEFGPVYEFEVVEHNTGKNGLIIKFKKKKE